MFLFTLDKSFGLLFKYPEFTAMLKALLLIGGSRLYYLTCNIPSRYKLTVLTVNYFECFRKILSLNSSLF